MLVAAFSLNISRIIKNPWKRIPLSQARIVLSGIFIGFGIGKVVDAPTHPLKKDTDALIRRR
jgi:hypothetical protein